MVGLCQFWYKCFPPETDRDSFRAEELYAGVSGSAADAVDFDASRHGVAAVGVSVNVGMADVFE